MTSQRIGWQLALALGVLLLAAARLAVAADDPYTDATENRTSKIERPYFGIHLHRLVLNAEEKRRQTEWPNEAIGALRLWDSYTRWADVSPAPGLWKFERMDAYVAQAQKHRAEILYVLGSPPKWASARPDEQCPYGVGCAAGPTSLALWEDYVRHVSQRYRGKIAAYELWNEPFFSELKPKKGPSDFFYGSVAEMVELARVARKVLDQVDPKALLVSPGFTGDVKQLELFLSNGGKHYVQAIAFHFYAANAQDFARRLAQVRVVMKRQGVQDLPLWNTEAGVEVALDGAQDDSSAERLTRSAAASRIAQFMTIGAAGGMSRYYYYAWDNDRSGMLTAQGSRHPAADVFEKMQSWLTGATLHGCTAVAADSVRCDGESNGQRFAIVWAHRPTRLVLRVPSGLKPVSVDRLLGATRDTINTETLIDGFAIGPEPIKILFGPK